MVEACTRAGASLLNPRETWADVCTGVKFKPDLECLKHPGTVISTTSIGGLVGSNCLGCVPCNPNLQLWATPEGYDRVVEACARVGARLLHPRETWADVCTGVNFKPDLKCLKHPDKPPITSTTLSRLQKGCFGCPTCRHKTEAKLFEWLKKQHPSWRHNELKLKNPKTGGTMSVDFHNPVLWVGFELDGNISGGHFDDDPANLTPYRDLEKENQMRDAPYRYQALRMLQEDVWHDKNGWENWARGELKRWATRLAEGKPPEAARHPDAPEYRGGIYARLRGKGAAPVDVDPGAPTGTTAEPQWGTGDMNMAWTGGFVW